MKYIYESHLGGLYATNKKLSYNEGLYEECGDSDWLLCTANVNRMFRINLMIN